MSAVLAIDTSTDACSVAFADGKDCLHSHRLLPRAHNRHILSMIDEVLAGRPLRDVDVFACGVGPGSFTGLRIAASVVQGLAWSLDKPVVGFCSLEAQARSALAMWRAMGKEGSANGDSANVINEAPPDGQWLLSATDAQIGQLYWRLFRIEQGLPLAVGDPAISKPVDLQLPDDVKGITVVGSGANLRSEFAPQMLARIDQWLPEVRPHAKDTASYIGTDLTRFEQLAADQLTPRYVQQDIGWKKLSEQPRRD